VKFKTLCMASYQPWHLHRRHAVDDPEVVWCWVEDVAVTAGVFRADCWGCHERFGFRRVMDTPPWRKPLIAGISDRHFWRPKGLKAGCRDSVQFGTLSMPGCEAACFPFRAPCVAVRRGSVELRMGRALPPHGAGIHAPEHHCETTEALICTYFLGLRVGDSRLRRGAPIGLLTRPLIAIPDSG